MIHPDQFISLAEETGHIVQLGAWVLKQAVTDLADWRHQVPRKTPLYVSVNVSARQFRDRGLVASVREALSESGLPPSLLTLELTESVLLGRDERIRSELDELKQLGVRLAIDDFGTGYSNLAMLTRLDVDSIKLDISLVRAVESEPILRQVLRSVLRPLNEVGVQMIAEGMETESQCRLVRELGCQYGQGWLFGRPQPYPAITSESRA
jgi:EAL domain-containing protein (putative c-di-GMP-specific phosphodiesterase class I)